MYENKIKDYHAEGCKCGKSLTGGALTFIVCAALFIKQAAVVTLAHVSPVVLGTAASFAARCWGFNKKEKKER